MGESAIKVAIRSRPLLSGETFPPQPITFHDGVMVQTPNKTFTYDFVFPPATTNQAVYNSAVANKISNIFEGYNVTILAYGSTGSGKTYTMGTDYSPKNISNTDMGIIPLGLNEIFRVLQSEKDVKTFSVKVSFIEIYQEAIYDLCHPNAKNFQKKDPKYMDKNGPKIQEEKDGSFKVTNLTETTVNCIEEALDILVKGSSVRHTSPTAKNMKSSRSHAIFTVYVEQQDRVTFDSKKAKFQLVDLAGSERMASSKTHGISAKEGTNINVSLFCLSKVIIALSESRSHIPYRESKLTRILQDSLGGNSHTVMIACVNPSSTSVEETLSTLRYADNTRNIKNKPTVNIDPPAVQIQKLKQQVEQLTIQLYAAQPLSHLNSDGKLNAEGKALELLKSAYTDITDLNVKLSKVEEKNVSISEYIKSIYEKIKAIIAELTPIAAVDTKLTIYLEKLEEIQAQCYHVTVNDNISTLMEDIQDSSETAEDYESCESVLPMEIETCDIEEALDASDDIFTPFKNSDEDLIEEMNGMAEKQKDSAKRLKDIDIRIDLANNIMQCLNMNFESVSEEEQVDTLVQKIRCLTNEKSTLERAMQIDKKFINENQERIGKYESDIKKLQDELRVAKKCLQVKDENKIKVQRLQKEMSDLRKLKVKLMNKAKECVTASAVLQKKKNLTIRKLTREKNKTDIEFSKLKTECSNKIRVLESKYKQALASKQALSQALKKKVPQPRQTVVKKKSQLNLEEWIDEEINIKIFNTNATADVESYVKESNELKEEIKKLEQLSPSEENKVQTNELADLKQLLEIQLNHIETLKKLPTDEDQSAKTYPWLDEVSDLPEAKILIEYLFNKCVLTEVQKEKLTQDSKVELECQKASNMSSQADVKELTSTVKRLEIKIEKMEWDFQQQTAELLLKHEAELLQVTNDLNALKRASMPTTEDPSRKRSLETTTMDYKEKFYRTQAELQKLQEEKECTQESMVAEFLDSDDEESFTNDPKDPDWRLTPAHKQAKRPRLESKTATDSTIPSHVDSMSSKPVDNEGASTSQTRPNMPCKCEGGCKSKRCRCQRSKVTCSGACSCRAENCFNIIHPSA